MRISVSHSTVYRYDAPVHQEPHTVRLRPRENASQRLLRYELKIVPEPAGRSECLDQDGNSITEVWFDRAMGRLEIHSSFDVETVRENPFDFLPVNDVLPVSYGEPLGTALQPYRSEVDGPVSEFAREIRGRAQQGTLAYLAELNRSIFEGFRQEVRDEGPPHPAIETLERRSGSCRDLAVLFCDACRAMSIAARFVSGYERDAADQEHAYMHAWAEVYLAGGGWRGYDPSRGIAVSTSHVAVAAAADPVLAAPITGTYRGTVKSAMEVSIALTVKSDSQVL
jgi:transglutaminase-like putative cysteine protease